MKNIWIAMAMLAALTAPAVAAPDYAVIHMEADVNRSADITWSRVGDYCAIKDWLGNMCVITSGTGDIGTMRKINGTIDEIMIAKTKYSYGYTQPTTTILYHGNLAVEPIDANHCKIVYTLIYDQSPLATPEAQAANRKMRTDRFTAGVMKMKAIAEAP
jgi:hypothetical protein